MKSNYDKYMGEIIELKEKVYDDFKKSGFKSYCEYIKHELKDFKRSIRKSKKAA